MSTESEKITIEQLSAELANTQRHVEQLTLELQEAKENLHQLVYRDGLSGLYNRRYMQQMIRKELERSLRYASPFSLVIFDLDDFAGLRENFGAANSDLVIMNVARIVEQQARPCDIVARYSDHQFAVLLPETDISGVKIFADRLRESIRETATLVDGKEIKTTISAGGTTFNPEAPQVTMSDFIKTAEQALSEASDDGNNQIRVILLSMTQDQVSE